MVTTYSFSPYQTSETEAYADYDFYTSEFGGMLISKEEYTRYALRASKYINNIINGCFRTVGYDIKMCACEIAEYYCKHGIDSKTILTESVGNYSVSYASDVKRTHDDELRALCSMWLPKHLIYRGAGKCFRRG